MAGVTYRFEMRAERTDGTWQVMQGSAAVYASAEEALMQAGADLALAANVHPVDVVAGEHHGYLVTAFGEPADLTSHESVEAARKTKEPKVLAGTDHIAKAADVMRGLWIREVKGTPSLMPNDVRRSRVDGVPRVDPADAPEGVDDPVGWAAAREADLEHEAAVQETLRRMREILA